MSSIVFNVNTFANVVHHCIKTIHRWYFVWWCNDDECFVSSSCPSSLKPLSLSINIFHTFAVTKEELSSTGTPRCVVRKDELEVYIDHFSICEMFMVISDYLIGKRVASTPYLPKSMSRLLPQYCHLRLYNDTPGLEDVSNLPTFIILLKIWTQDKISIAKGYFVWFLLSGWSCGRGLLYYGYSFNFHLVSSTSCCLLFPSLFSFIIHYYFHQ